MDLLSEHVKRLTARSPMCIYQAPKFVWDGRVLPPCPILEPFVTGLVCSQLVGTIAESYHMYRLPEATPWLVAVMGPQEARVMVTGPHTRIDQFATRLTANRLVGWYCRERCGQTIHALSVW